MKAYSDNHTQFFLMTTQTMVGWYLICKRFKRYWKKLMRTSFEMNMKGNKNEGEHETTGSVLL